MWNHQRMNASLQFLPDTHCFLNLTLNWNKNVAVWLAFGETILLEVWKVGILGYIWWRDWDRSLQRYTNEMLCTLIFEDWNACFGCVRNTFYITWILAGHKLYKWWIIATLTTYLTDCSDSTLHFINICQRPTLGTTKENPLEVWPRWRGGQIKSQVSPQPMAAYTIWPTQLLYGHTREVSRTWQVLDI